MAIQFASASDYLTLTSSLLNYNSAYTLMAFVRFNALSTFDSIFCLSDGTANNRDLLMLDTTTGTTLALRSSTGGSQTTSTDTTTLTTGTWYHLTIVRTSTTNLTLYINGESAVSNSRDVSSRASVSQMRVGVDQSASNSAAIDVAYAKAWATNLSAGEIAAEQSSVTAVKSSPYAVWSFISNANDSSGNGHNWTVSGTPTYVSGPAFGTTYKMEIDSERDGTFGASIDDITAYITGQVTWGAGLHDSFASIAQPATGTFQLSNTSGAFTQESGLLGGSELVTNGDFTNWTSDNPDNWTVSGESGSDPEVSEVGAGSAHSGTGTGACNIYSASSSVYIQSSSFSPTVGKRYLVSLEITYFWPADEGGIVVKNGTTAISPVYHTTGKKTFVFTAVDTTFRIYAAPGGDRTNMTIDNVSVIEVPLYYDALRSGTLCRFSVTDSSYGIAETLFIAPIASVALTIGAAGERLVTVSLQDYNAGMLNAEYTPELILDATTDQPIKAVFDAPVTPIPYGENYWMLGREGSSELGETTTLYDHDATDMETGQTVFPYAGDLADKGAQQRGISPQMYLEDVVTGEAGGRLWYEMRTGKYTFHNRNHDPQQSASAVTLTAADWMAVDYRYGDDIINDLTVSYIPRKVGDANSVVWVSEETPFIMKPGDTRKITARYRENGTEGKVGVLEGVVPQIDTDYTTNAQEDGSSQDLSKHLTVGCYFGAANGELWLANNSGYTFYVTHLQLRGVPLTQYDEQSHQYTDANSIARHQHKPKNMNMRMMDKSLAEQYTSYIVNRYSEPMPKIASVTFSANASSANKTAGLTYGVGTRITVSDAWSTHDADYIVIGEEHTVSVGMSGTSDLTAYTHDIVWRLKPIARDVLWVLEESGKSEMGITTRLGF